MHGALHSPLWRHGDFLKFWSAASLSRAGDAVTMLALPLIAIGVLEATPFQVRLLGITRQRLLLVAADVARGLCLFSVPLAYVTDLLSSSQLYAVAFVNGVLTVFFDVAANAYLPMLVIRSELVDGNSKLELSRSGSQIVGPGLAGLLIELASAPFALIADAVSFLARGRSSRQSEARPWHPPSPVAADLSPTYRVRSSKAHVSSSVIRTSAQSP